MQSFKTLPIFGCIIAIIAIVGVSLFLLSPHSSSGSITSSAQSPSVSGVVLWANPYGDQSRGYQSFDESVIIKLDTGITIQGTLLCDFFKTGQNVTVINNKPVSVTAYGYTFPAPSWC